MKKQFTLLGIVVAFAIIGFASIGGARSLGWLYGDTLVIGNPASPVASINSSGVLTATGVTNTGALSGTAITGSTLALTGKLVPASKTLAQLAAITPAAKGEVYAVSNGTMLICVSSGTGTGAFTSPISSTTACS
jgi:hypothetical protein